MFAVVANGIQTICKTQRQLDYILAVYPYPKFKKCYTEEEARNWIRVNKRQFNAIKYSKYGDTATFGYATIEYFITNNNIYYNIKTEKVGYIKIQADNDIKVDSRKSLLKVKVCNVRLDDSLIAHHIIAIRRILKLLGEYRDIDIVVPDISIFLALTKYSGNNYVIRGCQRDIASRLGAVSITINS